MCSPTDNPLVLVHLFFSSQATAEAEVAETRIARLLSFLFYVPVIP